MEPKLTTVGQLLINSTLPEEHRDYERVWDKSSMRSFLTDMAKKMNPDEYREMIQRLTLIGLKSARQSGSVCQRPEPTAGRRRQDPDRRQARCSRRQRPVGTKPACQRTGTWPRSATAGSRWSYPCRPTPPRRLGGTRAVPAQGRTPARRPRCSRRECRNRRRRGCPTPPERPPRPWKT